MFKTATLSRPLCPSIPYGLEISKAGEELEDLVIKKAKDIKKASKLEELEKYLRMHDNVHERINKYSKHQKVKKWSNPRTAEYAKGLLK